MEIRNQTAVSEFLVLGLTDDPTLQPVIFSQFLSMYLVTLLGNLLIILTVSSYSHLRNHMYFLLSNLFFTHLCFSTTTIPKMLVNIQRQSKTIGYTGCLRQMGFVLIFAELESSLFALMTYDRYVALCCPLRYLVIMYPHFCVLLILLSLSISIVDGLLHSLMMVSLSLCTNLEIPHFCELAEVISLACYDALINYILIYLAVCIFGGVPLSVIILSYIHIVSSVLRMPSSERKYKAFSTCVSHLSLLSPCFMEYLFISSLVTDSPGKTAVASVMYTVNPPMLTPFNCSLRNRVMKESLRKLIIKTHSHL